MSDRLPFRSSPGHRGALPAAVAAVAALVLLVAAAASHAQPPAVAHRVLRVCADPNALPLSDERGTGFENRLAELLARDLGATVEYTWWAQRRGFVRNTMKAGKCDVLMGVPSGFGPVLTTRPYYRSSYVFVTRTGTPAIRSLDDPRLRRLRVGVQMIGNDYANTPPAQALANRGITRNVRGYPVYGDYREASPASRIVRAVADRDVDVAIVWGPLAGYFASRERVPLRVTPVSPEVDPPYLPFVFDMTVGVRRDSAALRDTLDAVLGRRRAEVDRLLARYGVPRRDVAAVAGR